MDRRDLTWLVAGLCAAIVGACAEGGSTTPPGFEEVGGAPITGAGGQGGSSEEATSTSESAGGSSSTTNSTSTTATTSTSSGSTTSSTTTSTSGTGGNSCADAAGDETEETAKNLGTITDCDGAGSVANGVLSDPDDVDWYRYAGDDVAGCMVDPARDLSASGKLRICKFFQCDNGATPEFTCPAGAAASTSPGGRAGCCSLGSFTHDVKCTTFGDDGATVYLRLDQAEEECVTYSVAYHF